MSGAFLESELLEAFEEASFYGIELVDYQTDPWAVIEGLEFRSVTVRAFKGKEGACRDRKQAVIYRGPWKSVVDDDGHVLRRGVRTAVCEKNSVSEVGKSSNLGCPLSWAKSRSSSRVTLAVA